MISLFLAFAISFAHADWVEIGVKKSTEDQLVSEIIAQTIEKQARIEVKRSPGADTETAFRAMLSKRIDMYVEYSGALAEVILKKPELKTIAEINQALSSQRVRISNPLGFKKSGSSVHEGVVVVREDLIKRIPKVWEAVKSLEGSLSDDKVIALKHMVEVDKKTVSEAAHSFVMGAGSNSPYMHWIYVLLAALIGLPLAMYTWKR